MNPKILPRQTRVQGPSTPRKERPAIPTSFWWVVAVIAIKQMLMVALVDPSFSRVGPRFLLITIASTGLALALASPLSIASGRRQAAGLLGATTLLTLIGYTHVLYYRQYQILPTIDSLQYLGQLSAVGGSIGALIRASDIWIITDITILALCLAVPPLGRRLPPIRPGAALTRCTIGVALFTTVMLPFSNRVHRPWRGAVHMAGNLNFIGYHYHSLLTALLRRITTPGVTAELREEALSRLESDASQPRTHLFGAAEGLNLIVIQFESLQGFAFGRETPAGPVTPVLDQLADESIVFPNFFHQAAAGNTSDAQFASNCSILPPGNRPAAFEYADRELDCLPRILSRHGYQTHSYQTLAPDFWNAAAIEEAIGFDFSYSGRDFVLDEKIGMGLSDASKLRQMLEKLTDLSEPFHALIYTTTSHSPFRLGEHAILDGSHLPDGMTGRYLQSVHYTDAAIGEFIEGLRERELLDRSVLIIFGDHHGLNRQIAQLDKILDIEPDDETEWFIEERRVPLLIRLPYGRGADTRPGIGTQIDLPPTILRLLGIGRVGLPMLGRDLLAPLPEEETAIFPDGSALSEERLWSMAAGGRCYSAGTEVIDEECADLRALAQRESDLSRALTNPSTLEWLGQMAQPRNRYSDDRAEVPLDRDKSLQ